MDQYITAVVAYLTFEIGGRPNQVRHLINDFWDVVEDAYASGVPAEHCANFVASML